MIPLLIGAGLIAVVALNDDDDEDEQEEEITKRTMSEKDLPPSVRKKLKEKRRR